jgi:hypothetical protein
MRRSLQGLDIFVSLVDPVCNCRYSTHDWTLAISAPEFVLIDRDEIHTGDI